MQRKPLVVALVLAAVAVLAGTTTPDTGTPLASSGYNRGWNVPSSDAIAALDD